MPKSSRHGRSISVPPADAPTKRSLAGQKRALESDDRDAIAPQAKRPRQDWNTMIQILVGLSEVPSKVHEALICKTSKFFQAACSERWADSGDRVVRLVDEQPMAVNRYIEWVYRKTIDLEEIPKFKSVATVAIEAFLLGDRLEDLS